MFPRKVGSAWEVYSPAKLNLYLEVLSQQASGYHELETLMVPVGLWDCLRWEPAKRAVRGQSFLDLGLKIFYWPESQSIDTDSTESQLPTSETNLIIRAANLLAQDAGVRQQGRFTLHKRIPIKAGMGGGSSNAAAALILANNVWGTGYRTAQLMELGAQIGSDVPFFVAQGNEPGAAICRGRGERVESIGSLGRLYFVIVKPPIGISTADVFAKAACEPIPAARVSESSHRLARLIEALRLGSLNLAFKLIANRLESYAETFCDTIRQIRKTMRECGCLGWCMTGSGSSYVGIVRTAKQARSIAGLLTARRLGTVFTTMNYY